MKNPAPRTVWSLLAGLLVPSLAYSTSCERPVAHLVAVQGEALEQEHGSERWQAVAPDHAFCTGDRIRTLEHSRATLELNNKTFLSLEQRTTIVFSGLKPREPSWLELIKGVIYLRSRTPSSLDIKTPFVNAAIKGTEFLVRADEDEGRVSVIEGRVEASNAQGQVLLTGGQEAIARAGAAPVKKLLIDPNDAVQWALHYPPLLDVRELKRADDPLLRRAADLYSSGRTDRALAALAPVDAPIVKAAMLLELGRADEATALLDALPPDDPRQADALPLRSVIVLARNDKVSALELAERATAAKPGSPAAWAARSYARQARFELDDALTAARESARLAPESARALARQAELAAALGKMGEARALAAQAVERDPLLARAWIVRGYTELNQGSAAQAEITFGQALRLDSVDPLARFGLGLAKIRQGRLEDGTADLEIAANLDPNDAMTRSYLGKAYFEQKNAKVAATELDMAKRLDPQDPTPYFYDAIKKQSENRPIEALQDMQKAVELNDHRAVYRSRQMLDSDLAARSAAQGRIYNDLGFGQRALVEGWKSVDADPGNYSAHRLLADNYASLPRHDLARTSELLQSQLLQPLNVTPLQPHLAERNLAIAPGGGPSVTGFNEFNPLFLRDRFALQAAGLVGSNDTYGAEVVHAGIWDDFSYSLGQYHMETNGFRPNNRVSQDIYNAFVQANITPQLNVQAEYRHKYLNHGDLAYNFDLKKFDRAYNRKLDVDTGRVGARYAFTPSSQLIGSAIYLSESESTTQTLGGEGGEVNTLPFRDQGYMLESQYLWHSHGVDVTAGGGYLDLSRKALSQTPSPFAVQPSPINDTRHGNAYVYSHIRFPQEVTWTLGGSADFYEEEVFRWKFNQLNPKVGVTWNITPSTTLRAAVFRTLKRGLLTDQTMEPTQIAGFNQLFDDPAGTRSWRYGIGLDQKFTDRMFGGFEVSRRHLDFPAPSFLGAFRVTSFVPFEMEIPLLVYRYAQPQETLYRAYFNWALTDELAFSASYQLEVFERTLNSVVTEYPFPIPADVKTFDFPGPSTRTHYAPVSLNYFHPSGFFGRLGATYVNQTVESSGIKDRMDDFILVDTGIGFRLPKRYGILRFDVQNVLNQRFSYLGPGRDSGNRTPHEEKPLFYPMRTFWAQFTLSF
jgi:Flp pilus assembly protein TadD